MNSLSACFSPTDDDKPGQYIDKFDWHAYGISVPYIIFITGRCGSTLLTHFLRDSKLCGSPDEFFNETAVPYYNRSIGAHTFREYFSATVERSKSNSRFGFEIDPIRFGNLRPLLDFPNVFSKEFCRFFWMTRRDILSQAWSYAKAKRTGIWHQYANGGQMGDGRGNTKSSPTAQSISDRDWWHEIIVLLRNEQTMEALFRKYEIVPCRFDYESLISDKYRTIIMVLHHLGCSGAEIADFLPRIEDRMARQNYEDRYPDMIRFYEIYAEEIEEIEEFRLTIDLHDLRKKLASRHNITV